MIIRDHGVFVPPAEALTDAELVAQRLALDIELANRAEKVRLATERAEEERVASLAAEARKRFPTVIDEARNERAAFNQKYRAAVLSLMKISELGQEATTLANTINVARALPDPIVTREAAEAGVPPNPLPALLDEFKENDGIGWSWHLAIPMPVVTLKYPQQEK